MHSYFTHWILKTASIFSRLLICPENDTHHYCRDICKSSGRQCGFVSGQSGDSRRSLNMPVTCLSLENGFESLEYGILNYTGLDLTNVVPKSCANTSNGSESGR